MENKNFLAYNCKGLKLLFSILPGSMVIYCVLQMIHGISWMLQVVSMQIFFDAVQVGGKNMGELVGKLLLLGGGFLFAQFMNGAANCYGQILNKRAGKEINLLIFKALDGQEPIAFEDAEELDRIHKAIRGSERMFWVSTTVLDILFFYVFYFVMMSWYMYTLEPILSISTFIVFVPNMLAKHFHTTAFDRFEEETASLRRKCEYYEKCMVDKQYLKETRILGCSGYFKVVWRKALLELNRLHFRAQLHKEKVNLLLDVFVVTAYGSIVLLLVYYVMNGVISIGAFAAVLASLREFYGFMNEVVSERFAWAAENVSTVKNYLQFIQDADKVKKKIVLPEKFDIRLEGVRFSYPQQNEAERRFALDNIDLQIPWGQTIALVGENGSGKSTLCNVIGGLYTPVQGNIFYGDISGKTGKITEGISAVFQKFCCYKLRLEENITISETGRAAEKEELYRICQETGVNGEWANGMAGVLGKEFGGTELSGGQWQRIALARGMFRRKRLLILDEPTAAIDTVEEDNLYRKFQEMCKGCTAIIVTHRLASAKIADRIVVMKKGRIVQDGRHEDLIAVEGEYKRMYELQSKWYQ